MKYYESQESFEKSTLNFTFICSAQHTKLYKISSKYSLITSVFF